MATLARPGLGGRTEAMKKTIIALSVIVVVAVALFFLFGKASAPSGDVETGSATSTLTTSTTTITAPDGTIIVVPPGSPSIEDAPAFYYKG